MATQPMNVKQLNSLVQQLGNITIAQVCQGDSSENYILDTEKLLKTVLGYILSNGNIESLKISEQDAQTYEAFVAAVNDAVIKFLILLDRNNDGVVDLVDRTSNGEYVAGADVNKFMKEVGVDAYKNASGETSNKVFSLLMHILTYMTSDDFTETVQEFEDFQEACKNAYVASKKLRSIDVSDIIKGNATDMMNFLIMLCIIIVPVINCVKQRIDDVKTGKTDQFVISSQDIHQAVEDVYGTKAEFLIHAIQLITNTLVKAAVTSGFFSKVRSWFKRVFICSCCSKSTATD